MKENDTVGEGLTYYGKSIFWLTLLGVLFSGYLSATKLLTSQCALSEPCPYFLGYPACFFGFGLFLILFIASLVGVLSKDKLKAVARVVLTVSILGTIYAGYLAVPEIKRLVSGERNYALGLPTCAYGLIFYVAICVISLLYFKRVHKEKII